MDHRRPVPDTHQSSSCAVRSSRDLLPGSQQVRVRRPACLIAGENRIVLKPAVQPTDYESAALPQSVYVQYGARLGGQCRGSAMSVSPQELGRQEGLPLLSRRPL